MEAKRRLKQSSQEEQIRAALDQHWAASDANDFETEHRIYLEDAVLEYPQSGERTRGRSEIQNQREQKAVFYPTNQWQRAQAIVTQKSTPGFSRNVVFSDKWNVLTKRDREEEPKTETRVVAGVRQNALGNRAPVS